MLHLINLLPFLIYIVFIFMLARKVFSLRKKGVSLRSTPAVLSPQKIILYIVFFIVILVFTQELIRPAFFISRSLLPDFITIYLIQSLLLKIIGSLILIISLILLYLTLSDFNNSLRFGIGPDNQGKLITSGVFTVSRNPFFLSIILLFTGIAFIFPSIFFLLIWLAAITAIHLFILKEEKFMCEYYGDKYREYRQKVRRYLSFKNLFSCAPGT